MVILHLVSLHYTTQSSSNANRKENDRSEISIDERIEDVAGNKLAKDTIIDGVTQGQVILWSRRVLCKGCSINIADVEVVTHAVGEVGRAGH